MRRSPRIAVVGSINCDLVVCCERLPDRGETVLADSSAEVSGGKGANQAVAASRIGGQVTLIGRIGDDLFGERLLATLNRENLDTSLVWPTANCASGMAVVAVEHSGENSIMVVAGANGRLTANDVTAAKGAIEGSDLLLLQFETTIEAVRAAIAAARAKGVRTILNPSPLRGSLPQELLDVDVVCPNRIEAGILLGSPIHSRESALHAAVELRRRGPRTVVITLGSEGAVFCDGNKAEWVAPFAVDVVDTTAAGDAFVGALAVRLAEGTALRDAVEFACAAGALTATRPGAQPSLPTRSEVDSLLKHVSRR